MNLEETELLLQYLQDFLQELFASQPQVEATQEDSAKLQGAYTGGKAMETEKRSEKIHRWKREWKHLQVTLEVYQFPRDAGVGEIRVIAQNPYLRSVEFGRSIDAKENLMKEHEVETNSSRKRKREVQLMNIWKTSSTP